MRISILLSICFYSQFLLAQIRIPVKIKIVDESLNNVDKAFIFINDKQVDCSYLNGIYLGKINTSDKYEIKIKHLSYSDFDTVIYSLDPIIDFKVDLVLKEYSIDEVEIISNKTINMSCSHNLKDMYLHGNKILTLTSRKGENLIEIFDIEGVKEYDLKLESAHTYTNIYKGLKEHSLYLCSGKNCQNILLDTTHRSMLAGETITKDYFDSKVKGVLSMDSNAIFRMEQIAYNTTSTLVKYKLPDYERTIVYEIEDTKTLKEVYYNINQVIKLYNYNSTVAVNNPSSKHYGMVYPEFEIYPQSIKDLNNILIDTSQTPYITRLQSIELKNHGKFILKDGEFFIIDNLPHQFLKYSKQDLSLIQKIKLPDGKKSSWDFIPSLSEVVIEDTNSQIYRLNEQKDNWEKISTQNKGYYDILSKIIVEDKLYILAREHINSRKNKIFIEKI